MDETKKRRGHMNAVCDQADRQSARIQNAPKNVVVPGQLARTGVSQVRKACGPSSDGLAQNFGRGIRVAETDLDPKGHGERNGVDGATTFRRECHQHGIAFGNLSHFADVRSRRIAHHGRIVRAAKTWFLGKERPLDVTAGDGRLQF